MDQNFFSYAKSLIPSIKKATRITGTMTSRGEGNLQLSEYARSLNRWISYGIFQNTPYFQRLGGMTDLFEWYYNNPILYSLINIKARAESNKIYQVKNKYTGQAEPFNTRKDIPKALYKRLNNPNCMQKRWEYVKQKKTIREICGNSLTYGNVPTGFPRPRWDNIQAMWQLWPQFTQFKLTGKYFEATEIKDIISGWRFEYSSYKRDYRPEDVLLQNNPNVDPQKGLIFGFSDSYALVRPLSNIDMGYETRNVISKNRGMRIFISSDRGDESGKLPLLPEHVKIVENEMKNYGTLEGQNQFYFSSMPLKPTPIDQDVAKLGVFEEIAQSAMVCCHAKGVPEILLKCYLSGATFENQRESVKRMYEDTIIPESEDDDVAMNTWLGLDDEEWEIVGSFDHISALQKPKKDEAEGNVKTSAYMKEMFLIGGVTLNQWLEAVGIKRRPNGDRTIFDMTPQEQQWMLNVLAKAPAPKEQNPDEEDQQNNNQQQQAVSGGKVYFFKPE